MQYFKVSNLTKEKLSFIHIAIFSQNKIHYNIYFIAKNQYVAKISKKNNDIS